MASLAGSAAANDVYAGAKAKTWRQLWLRHQLSVLSAGALLVLALGAYHVFSDGDFSFLMTLGSLLVLFAFVLLAAKVALGRSVKNISLKTLECYALVFAARLCSILRYEGYLPYDRSGDWLFKATEAGALVIVLALIGCVLGPFRASYKPGADRFSLPGLPAALGAVVLAVPALLFAVLLHPNLNGNFVTDTAWAFALYLEAVAMLPQFVLFDSARSDRSAEISEIEPLEANFVFALAVARALHLVFWASSFHELNDKAADAAVQRKFPGHFVVVAQAINLLFMADYVWAYLLAARAKKPFLPTSATHAI
jgi:ER lumen protein retaining receptor